MMKPATYTRLSTLLFAEICAEAGLPPGVFNVITGTGPIGSKLAEHPDVDKVHSSLLFRSIQSIRFDVVCIDWIYWINPSWSDASPQHCWNWQEDLP